LCSIIGYLGSSSAAPLLVEGLRRMEYRGYDSVGIATLNDGKLLIKKGVGKVAEVSASLHLKEMVGDVGIGHTRWATHGAVTATNAHPHSGCKVEVVVVHNGVIENYHGLKEELLQQGHVFKSETDSEVIAHLLEHFLSLKNDVKEAMINTCNRLRGSFAFVAVFDDSTLSGARFDEPLIVGITGDGYFVSSDVLGFLKYTDMAIFLDNKDIVLIKGNTLSLFDFDGTEVIRAPTKVAKELGDTDKGLYAHFTLKEIHEQKYTIIKSTQQNKESIEKFCNTLTGARDVFITGSGTSYHSALLGKHILSRYGKIHVETILSSEFQYPDNRWETDLISGNSVVIAISQSGETADVLQSVKSAREKGSKILSIVNVPTSSLARFSDCFLEVKCGPEVGVAATKSFTSQLAVLYYIADTIGGSLTGISTDMTELSMAVENTLLLETRIGMIAKEVKDAKDIYILGRSIHLPICLEGALKIKELAYIHAEGMAAGEMKHGPLALIDKSSVVVVLNPNDSTYTDTVSNAHVLKSRGAKVISISSKGDPIYDYCITIPYIRESLLPLVEIIPLQILAYYLALYNNIDPDYPRNLAKSVTVK
jgi:glucosamine--fructose-6-phosphate aminotransferase (isomerizing)